MVLRLRESGWEGGTTPPILRSAQPETTVPESQDPAATPVATFLELPGVGEQPRTPTPPSPTPYHPPCENPNPKSPVPPSPSTSITALSDFTIADSLDNEPALEPETTAPHEPILETETIAPHDMFYLDDGSVEVLCGKTLFRVHAGALSFHSPVLRQMFSSENLATFESLNGCPRVVSSDTNRFRDSLEDHLSTWVICPSFNRMFSHSQFHSQIPGERQSSRLPHLLIPPQSFVWLRDANSPNSIARDDPRCIPRGFQGTRPLQGARGGRVRTQATSQCRAEPFRSTESYIGLADGVLYGSSKGIGLIDEHSASIGCDALRPDVEMCDKRVDDTSRDGTEGNTSGRLHNFQLRGLFLDGLSLPPLEGTFGGGDHWSTSTNFRPDYGVCGWGHEDITGVIGE